MAIDIDHILTAQEQDYQKDECRLSGRTYLWQHVSQSLNPSAGMTLIIGESGSGKSFWYQKLQQELPNHDTIICQRNLSLMSLIKQLSCLFSTPVPLGPHSIVDQAKIVLSKLAFKETHYLLIDDATWLSGDALTFLIYLSQYNTSHGLNIFLFGTPQLLQRTTQANTLNLYIHEIILRGMDMKETEAFIHETYHTNEALDPIMVRRIHQASGGAPREIMKLVKDSWHALFRPVTFTEFRSESGQLATQNTEPSLTIQSTPTKRLTKIVSSLLLFALAAALMFIKQLAINPLNDFFNPKTTAQPAGGIQLELSNLAGEPEAVLAPAETNARIFLTEQADLSPEAESTSEEFSPTELLISQPEVPVDFNDMPIYLPKLQEETDSESQAAQLTNLLTEPGNEDWLSGNGYAIQLGLSPEDNTAILDQIQRAIPQHDNLHKICLSRAKKRVCLLMMGPYNTQSQAVSILNQLPTRLIKQEKPWIRTLKSIRNEQANES